MAIVICSMCNKRIDLDYKGDTYDFDQDCCEACAEKAFIASMQTKWPADDESTNQWWKQAERDYGGSR